MKDWGGLVTSYYKNKQRRKKKTWMLSVFDRPALDVCCLVVVVVVIVGWLEAGSVLSSIFLIFDWFKKEFQKSAWKA